MSTVIEDFKVDYGRFPDALDEVGMDDMRDPWGNPYQYLNIETAEGPGSLRKDKFLVPLNTDFDLYSMGKDGESKPPLTAKASHDDVVRANDGGYVGIATGY
jgi:general secretion pathway protein G